MTCSSFLPQSHQNTAWQRLYNLEHKNMETWQIVHWLVNSSNKRWHMVILFPFYWLKQVMWTRETSMKQKCTTLPHVLKWEKFICALMAIIENEQSSLTLRARTQVRRVRQSPQVQNVGRHRKFTNNIFLK